MNEIETISYKGHEIGITMTNTQKAHANGIICP